MSITENFNASAAAFAACLSSARNHDACVRPGLVGVPYTRMAGTGLGLVGVALLIDCSFESKRTPMGSRRRTQTNTLLDGLLQSVRSWATPKFRGSARRRAKSRDGTGGSRVARQGCVSARARTGAQYKIS